MLPEDIGIPNHVRQMLQNSKVPVHSSSTLPYLKPRELRGSLTIERFQESTTNSGSHPNLARKFIIWKKTMAQIICSTRRPVEFLLDV